MEGTVQSTANAAMKEKYEQTSPWSLSISLNSSYTWQSYNIHKGQIQLTQKQGCTQQYQKKPQPNRLGCELYKNEAPLIPKN
jgi:hypothetical protein